MGERKELLLGAKTAFCRSGELPTGLGELPKGGGELPKGGGERV